MPKSKKKTQTFDVAELRSETTSQLDGLRLVKSKRSGTPAQGNHAGHSGKGQGEAQSPEPEVISKLIDFIKSI